MEWEGLCPTLEITQSEEERSGGVEEISCPLSNSGSW